MINVFGTFRYDDDGCLFFWSSVLNLVQTSCITENDLHFVPDIPLITSCKLTSGSAFWSREPLRVVVLHFYTKFYANTFIQ